MAKITDFVTLNNPVRKYRLKEPAIVEARQFTADEAWECLINDKPFWGQFSVTGEWNKERREVSQATVQVRDEVGATYWRIGDYVVRDDQKYYGMAKEIFEAKYELLK